jgi:hypothetical protein
VNNRSHRRDGELGWRSNSRNITFRECSVADLLIVVLTVTLFAALTVLVKAAERR